MGSGMINKDKRMCMYFYVSEALYKYTSNFITQCNGTDSRMRWHAWDVKLDEAELRAALLAGGRADGRTRCWHGDR